MPKARTIRSCGITQRYSEAMGLLRAPGDYVTVVRGVPRSIVMQCPDGCGELLTVNLDRRSGPAWRSYERNGKLTVYPSVWRETGCKAHFVIWRDHLLWFDGYDTRSGADPGLVEAVQRALPGPGAAHRHYEEIADELSEIPWEVLWVCQTLTREGRAVSSERATKFGRATKPPPRPLDVDVTA